MGGTTGSNPVCVAYARLIECKPYEQKPGFHVPPEASIDIGVFELREVVRGSMASSPVYVPYAPNTLRGALPTNAILIVTFWEGSSANYKPIGEEAWRGILPDTQETRATIEVLTAAEISQTPSGRELPEAAARQIALNKIETLNDYTGFSGKHKFSAVKREPFGWFFAVSVLDERQPRASVNTIMVRISDEGEVVSCRLDPFGSLYTASEWDSVPSISL